jgi:hypothetical protein
MASFVSDDAKRSRTTASYHYFPLTQVEWSCQRDGEGGSWEVLPADDQFRLEEAAKSDAAMPSCRILSGMYQANVAARTAMPLFWSADGGRTVRLTRTTWWRKRTTALDRVASQLGRDTFEPVDETSAAALELAYTDFAGVAGEVGGVAWPLKDGSSMDILDLCLDRRVRRVRSKSKGALTVSAGDGSEADPLESAARDLEAAVGIAGFAGAALRRGCRASAEALAHDAAFRSGGYQRPRSASALCFVVPGIGEAYGGPGADHHGVMNGTAAMRDALKAVQGEGVLLSEGSDVDILPISWVDVRFTLGYSPHPRVYRMYRTHDSNPALLQPGFCCNPWTYASPSHDA